jgi:hypothetical protein
MYFNNGSSEIPNRYVLLNKDQVFQRRSIRVLLQKNLSDRSKDK